MKNTGVAWRKSSHPFSMIMNKKLKNIIIANDAEAFSFIINAIDDGAKRVAKINKEHFLSSRFLFWEGDDKIVITPFPIEKPILIQAQSIGYKNIENWYPSKVGVNLSDAIVKDRTLFKNLKKVIRNNPGIILSPYSYTRNLADLIKILKKANLKFHVDQQPKKKTEQLVDYLGSKVGFRTEMQKLKGVPSPRFFVCASKRNIIESTILFYQQNMSCVIKAYSGEGGWGMLMIHKENYTSRIELIKKLQLLLSKDTIWATGPYIVEEFIPSLKGDENSPSIEVFIDNSGFKITYACNQVVDSSGVFLGILMGKKCPRRYTIKKLNATAEIIASRYFKLGYRGFFDVDYIASKDGVLYPIETNVRRTGGTHVFDLTRKLFGNSWFNKTVVLSTDSFYYGDTVLSAKEILNKMSEITFPIKGQKKGVVVVAINSHEPYFSFIIFASSKGEVMQIHKKLTRIWNRDTLNIR